MKKPSIKQRHEIYKGAHAIIKAKQEDFVCHAIANYVKSNGIITMSKYDVGVFSYISSTMAENFPEAYLFKNPNQEWGSVWFSEYGSYNKNMELRLTVLEFCIEMTKPQSKTKK